MIGNKVSVSEKRVLVTANISAGKSTLINCLVGKKILPSSIERCTGNIVSIHERMRKKNAAKSSVSYVKKGIKLYAPRPDMKKITWDEPMDIYSTFLTFLSRRNYKMTYIDTPGINSAVEENHEIITKNRIREGDFDVIVHVIKDPDASEEMEYMEWLQKNAEGKEIIHVLNKVDTYRLSEDDIAESLSDVKDDVREIGGDDSLVFPISAYFGLLLKKEVFRTGLTAEDKSDLNNLKMKFKQDGFDLSMFYDKRLRYTGNNESKVFANRCGIYELEKIIMYGARQ